jgi:hypothetical protein
MSTFGPDPSNGSGVSPKDNTESGGEETTAEETTVTPAADEEETAVSPAADEDYAWGPPTVEPTVAETREQPALTDEAVTPAAEEPEYAPREAELLVTPATHEPAGAPLAEEPAEIPGAHDPFAAAGGPSAPAAQRPALSELTRRPTLGQSIVMVAGVLLFVWGFLPWYSDAGGSANAWSQETIPGLLLTATWVPLLSLAIAIFVAIKVFFDGFPDRVFGFTWAQLSIVVGLFGVLISLGFLVANRSLGNLGSLNIGLGLILSFVTALVLLGGAVLDYVGVGTDVANRPGRAGRPGRRP